jgi:hypothetical protein
MLQSVVVSGGDADCDADSDASDRVKIWDRQNGALLTTLRHHDCVVWNVNIWVDTLMTFSHDCTIAIMELKFQVGHCSSRFVTNRHGFVTNRHSLSQIVTVCHKSSRLVTVRHGLSQNLFDQFYPSSRSKRISGYREH